MAEPTTRVAVDVTFLRMERRPAEPAPGLAADCQVIHVPAPTVAFYRYLYDTVGAPHLWWLRRTEPDAGLQTLLHNPSLALFVLYRKAEPAGFFELDGRWSPDLNLSYFGLMPAAVGQGLGFAFLRHAVDTGWALQPRAMTVNTCTADHPRALPMYLRAGFVANRTVRERWDIPVRLGLTIPNRLRATG